MSVGPWQIVLILVIILVLFGAGKLPSVMKDLAKGVQAFKKGLRDEEGNPDSEPDPKKEETLVLEKKEKSSMTSSSRKKEEKKSPTPKEK